MKKKKLVNEVNVSVVTLNLRSVVKKYFIDYVFEMSISRHVFLSITWFKCSLPNGDWNQNFLFLRRR